MRRAELLAIADMGRPLFDANRRKGTLPFDYARFETSAGKGRTWVDYSIHEAARLIAARMMVTQSGVGWSEACAILREPRVGTAPRFNPYEAPGLHIAKLEFAAVGGGDPERAPRTRVFDGPLPMIVAAAESLIAAYGSPRRSGREELEIAGMVSVNLSRAYRIAYGRAEWFGIDLSKDTLLDGSTEGDL